MELKLETYKIQDKKNVKFAGSFGWDNKYIVTVHHYLPIKKASIKQTGKKLQILYDCSWNELLIIKKPTNYDMISYEKTQATFKLPKIGSKLLLNDISMTLVNYYAYNYDNINNQIHNLYLYCLVDNPLLKDFSGYSGLPVFCNSKIVGIECKTIYENDKTYLLILPIYYLLKTLNKLDKVNIYKSPISQEHKNKFIFHPVMKTNVTIGIYNLLEGDCNSKKLIKQEGEFIEKEDTSYKLNPRTISLFEDLFKNHNDYKKIMDFVKANRELIMARRYPSIRWETKDENSPISLVL